MEYQAGDDMRVLAKRWDVHRSTIATHLKRAGICLRRKGLSEAQVIKSIELYAKGWSCQRLAEQFGCDDGTIWQALRRNRVVLRAPWERFKE